MIGVECNAVTQVRTSARSEEFGLVREGKFEKGVAALQTEFLTDVFAVLLDGSRADEELFADLSGCQIIGYQMQDAAFGRR